MSWSSRLGGWASGRFSPFTSAPREVTNDDFSYITADEIDAQEPSHHASTNTHRHSTRPSSSSTSSQSGPDILVVRHQKISYPLRFPSHSIAENTLSIATLRHEAARALPAATGQAARVRMFFRGRNLKDDSRTARDEGLRPDDEILCVVGEPLRTTEGDADDSEDSDGVDDATGAGAGAGAGSSEPSGAARRKRKNRKGKKKGKGGAGSGNTSGTASPLPSDVRPEHLPIPATLHPFTNGSHAQSGAGPASRSPTPSARPAPQTAIQKLESLSTTFHALVPQCERFEAAPPRDPRERDFEHKKLTETILQTVLFKLDAVETEGDEEARARRKALVKYAQGWLGRLDAVVK